MKINRFFFAIIFLFSFPLAAFATPHFNRDYLTKKYQDISLNSQSHIRIPRQIQFDQVYPESETTYIYNYERGSSKSVDAALFISIFPGFFIHGLGHLYVERPKTFILLLGTEAVCSWMFLAGSVAGIDGDRSRAGTNIMIISIFGWVGSWIYDIIGSAQIANQSNYYSRQKSWYLSPEFKEYAGFKLHLQFDLSSK